MIYIMFVERRAKVDLFNLPSEVENLRIEYPSNDLNIILFYSQIKSY